MNNKLSDNRTKSQRERLLKWLQKRPITTFQAVEKLNIVRPAARICELRQHGHNIITHWTYAKNDSGYMHRIGQYVLFGGKND
jgi:hypothetical protein